MVGAGISTPSGVPDFRSPGTGYYSSLQQYKIPYPEAIFELSFFFRDPKPFFTFAKELYPGNYRPNATHYFLRLLHDKGLLLRLYTQNIDGLERASGIPASKLVEAHGSFASATCTVCRRPFPGEDFWADVMVDRVPRCPVCTGVVKPDIVFFGEMLPHRFLLHLADFPTADLLLILGTSLEVCQQALWCTDVGRRLAGRGRGGGAGGTDTVGPHLWKMGGFSTRGGRGVPGLAWGAGKRSALGCPECRRARCARGGVQRAGGHGAQGEASRVQAGTVRKGRRPEGRRARCARGGVQRAGGHGAQGEGVWET
ncbi:NAD-dependent protein deacetylase sirtuin-3, mitochondrial isoform 3-T5 [Megaptera novaeangliae]